MALLGSRLRSGRDQRVHRLRCTKHLFDEIDYARHRRLQRRRSRQGVRDQLQPRDQHPRDHRRGRYWEDGEWKKTEPLAVSRMLRLSRGHRPEEDLPALSRGARVARRGTSRACKRARFWMTFGENYLKHLRVLGNVGMTRSTRSSSRARRSCRSSSSRRCCRIPRASVRDQGQDLHRLPGARASRTARRSSRSSTTSATTRRRYREVQAQAISYTTGVPAVIGAEMMVTGKWRGEGVFNMEQFDPDPFLADVNRHGLPWTVIEPDAPMG